MALKSLKIVKNASHYCPTNKFRQTSGEEQSRSSGKYSEIPIQNNVWIALDFALVEAQLKIDLV
jgi:hypothetical protein